jgi:hypothetical protein
MARMHAGCGLRETAAAKAHRPWRGVERKPAPAGAAQTRVDPTIQSAPRLGRRLSFPTKLTKPRMRGDLVQYPGYAAERSAGLCAATKRASARTLAK